MILTAGLLYQQDRQVRQGAISGNVLSLPLDCDRTFTAWLPKVSLAWDLAPNIRIGALAQRASNPGGVNLNAATGRVEAFGAEKLWDFELFARGRLADGRLVLSTSATRKRLPALPSAPGQWQSTGNDNSEIDAHALTERRHPTLHITPLLVLARDIYYCVDTVEEPQ